MTRRVWVANRRELYTFVPVTEPTAGLPEHLAKEDIGMAYDLTITPMNRPPIIDGSNGQETVEIVADMVGLDEIRAKLRLYRPSPLNSLINLVWRAVEADDRFERAKEPKTSRVYCLGHRKHPGFLSFGN